MKFIHISDLHLGKRVNEFSMLEDQEFILTKIINITTSVGGCVPNVAIDLKKICPDLPISAIAKIGDDKEGEWLTDSTSSFVDMNPSKIVSNARLDLPEPERPVNTISLSLGMVRLTFFRLFSLAP